MRSRADSASCGTIGREGLCLLALFVMVAVLFGPLLATGRVPLLADLLHLFYPGYVFFRESLRDGVLPLWNPYTGCGEPFLADIERGVFYPPNLIYLLMPVRLGIVASVAFHVLLAGAGAYGLCRAWRLSRFASLLAGMTYAFNAYTITKIQFPTELAGAAWFPLVLGTYVLWLRRRNRRFLLLVSGALCLQFLAGFPEIVAFTVVALGMYALFVGVREARLQGRWRALFEPLFALAVAGALALLLSMVQFLPTWEALQVSRRAQEMDPRLHRMSLHPLAVFSLLVPSVYGIEGAPGTYWAPSCHAYATGAFYVGIVPVGVFVLVVFGRIFGRGVSREDVSPLGGELRVRTPFLLTLCVLFFVYSMGHYTPLFGVVRSLVPLLRQFVSPPKSLLCVVLPLSCLAGIGLDWLARTAPQDAEARRRWRRFFLRWGGCLTFVGIGVVMAACIGNRGALGEEILRRYFNLGSVPPQFVQKIPWDILLRDSVKLPLAGLVAVLLMQAYRFRPRLRAGVGALLVLLGFSDLLVTNRYLLHPGPAAVVEPPSVCLDQLHPKGSRVRFLGYEHVLQPEVRRMISLLPDPERREVLVPGTRLPSTEAAHVHLNRLARDILYSAWPTVDKAFNAYSANNFVSGDVCSLLDLIRSEGFPDAKKKRLLQMLNCDRIILPPELRDTFVTGKVGSTHLGIFEPPLPRAYVVGRVGVLEDRTALIKALASLPFDPRRIAFVDRAAAAGERFDDLQSNEVEHVVNRFEYVPNGLEIDLQSDAAGMLIITDAYYPGWSATVNGAAVRIFKVNGGLRGIRIAGGSSTVRMTYRPASLKVGAAISLLTLLAVFILILVNPTAASIRETENRQASDGE